VTPGQLRRLAQELQILHTQLVLAVGSKELQARVVPACLSMKIPRVTDHVIPFRHQDDRDTQGPWAKMPIDLTPNWPALPMPLVLFCSEIGAVHNDGITTREVIMSEPFIFIGATRSSRVTSRKPATSSATSLPWSNSENRGSGPSTATSTRPVSGSWTPSEVAAFTSDTRNEGQWHTDILEICLTSSDGAGAGTTYDVRTTPAMGVSEGTGTVLEHLPDHTVVEWRLGKLTSMITHTVATEGGGARFTRTVDLRFPPAMRLASPLIRPMVRKANTQFIANLKHILERSGTPR
jgi:hypothetical protein